MFKKLFITFAFILVGLASFAGPQEDVMAFFDSYVNAANTYDENIPNFYATDAKIIRVVIKKDGTKQSVATDTATYMKQLRISAKLAKINKYKNTYSDRVITQIGNDFKISCKRKPSTSEYRLPAHFVIGKDASGSYKIKEESMHTYQTAILKGANKE